MSTSPLNQYGLIGNYTTSALVSRAGSVDWCCMPWVDSPSIFGALLDENRGGRFVISPEGEFRSEQRYHQRTLVLETLFETSDGGRGVLTDWMPMEDESSEIPMIRRRVDVLSGRVAWQLSCAPRFNYGSDAPQVEIAGPGFFVFRGAGPDQLATLGTDLKIDMLTSLKQGGDRQVQSRFVLESGQSAHFVLCWGRRNRPLPLSGPSVNPRATIDSWQSWAHRCPPEGCELRGPWHDTIVRASLALRILGTESVTTSASLNSARNWDYRYFWIRDTQASIRSLHQLGHATEARRIFARVAQVARRDGAAGLQAVYRVDGGRILPESELNFLSGYRGSRPVRVGNLSSQLFQLDVYGHVLLAAEEFHKLYGPLPEDLWPTIADIADLVSQAWRRPDHGPWESRLKSEHFVASKALSWAAIDRACRLGEALGKRIPKRWRDERQTLHRTICAQGYDDERRCFVRSFGDRDIDSSALILPLIGFLPWEDSRIQNTLLTLQAELSVGGSLVLRDRSTPGPFLLPSLKMVSCLAQSGHVNEASDRLAELCSYASSLGMFAEQVDPTSGELTGNLPCASVHVALIQAGWDVAQARRKLRSEKFETVAQTAATESAGSESSDELVTPRRPPGKPVTPAA